VHTERLELRPLAQAAAAALLHDRTTAALELGAELPDGWPHADLVDVLPWQAAAAPGEEHFGVWVIIERDTGRLCGDIGFLGPPGPDGAIEIGYSVVPSCRRRGYATEAARALVGWALSRPDVRSVVAHCDTDNVASVRILEGLGFTRDGMVDGQLRWRS
jgi:ribosomal-protein-alanine N-acetyltransferase